MKTLKSSILLVSVLLVTLSGVAHAQMIVANVCEGDQFQVTVCTASCPAGHEAIDGGGIAVVSTQPSFLPFGTSSIGNPNNPEFRILNSSPAGISGFAPGGNPSGGADGWSVTLRNSFAPNEPLFSVGVWAVCADPTAAAASVPGFSGWLAFAIATGIVLSSWRNMRGRRAPVG